MKSIAVANGKGGVGKTSLSVSLAISLAEHGHSALLFDADLGLANIDLILGLQPQTTLKHVLVDGADIKDAVLDGPEGVRVVTGGSGVKELTCLERTVLDGIVQKAVAVGKASDFLVFDTASGLEHNVMAFLTAADRVLIVATPDPTSIMDAYATTKVLFAEKQKADVSLVVNMADDLRHGLMVYERYKAIVGQFLNREVELAGVVPKDDAVVKAARARQPFILHSPKCKASKSIDQLVDWMTADKEQQQQDPSVGLLQRMRSVFAAFKKDKPEAEPESDAPAEEKRAA